MQLRPLGRTGVQVSPLCLGAMMFGPWGNDDRADSIRIIYTALDAGINVVDTADVYSGGVSEEIVEAQWASRDRHLERFVTEQPPYSILVRGIEEDVLPTTQRHGMGTLTYSPLAGGWLSGRWRKDAAGTPTSSARPSARFDMSSPANQRKLDVVEDLAQLAEQTGITLIELAIAFVLSHPGVTSAIVDPRTMEQLESYLPAADIPLSTEVLDRIDKLVAPGVTLNPDDISYGDHTLTPAARRR